jgi:hypothetical protein
VIAGVAVMETLRYEVRAKELLFSTREIDADEVAGRVRGSRVF